MLSWLDSSALAVALYALAGVAAIVIGMLERRAADADDDTFWPTFWFATGALLLVMALGRGSHVADLLTDFGRDRARSGGWYDVRRSLQATLIGAVAAIWAITVLVAIWRVPARRRRYLPTAIAVFTLVCFVGVRLVSLHQVDAVLHRNEVLGATVGALVEVGLLFLIVVLIAWRVPRSRHDRQPEPVVHV